MRWISPPTRLEVARFRFESASMLRSMRRFSSSYSAITISIATKAQGAAATTLMLAPCSPGEPFRKWRETHRTPHEAKETPNSRSASVSCRRLSCQNTTATATYSMEAGITSEMAITLTALAAAHSPKNTASTSAGILHGFRCE